MRRKINERQLRRLIREEAQKLNEAFPDKTRPTPIKVLSLARRALNSMSRAMGELEDAAMEAENSGMENIAEDLNYFFTQLLDIAPGLEMAIDDRIEPATKKASYG
jgi:hypothetical protein